MSVRRRKNWVAQQRVDVPDMKSIESACSNDFDELISTLVTGPTESYVIRGFEFLMSGAIGGSANGLQLLVDNAAILHGRSNESGTFYNVPVGTSPLTMNSSINPKVIGSFVPSALNFISLEFKRTIDETTIGPVAVWNPTNKNEVTKNLPLAVLLDYTIKISTSAFSSNSLPLSVVTTDSVNNVIGIEDRRPNLFRLGSAGFSEPDPFYVFPWNLQPQGRVEGPTKSTSSSQNPFRGGDKQINNLKTWMDVVMSQFLEIKGTTYWYDENTGGSINSIRADLANTIFTGKGIIAHDPQTPGKLTWTTDIFLKFIGGRTQYKIEANTGNNLILLNNQVAYINITRDQPIVPYLIWVNGGATVKSVGNIAWTGDLEAGDFVVNASEGITKHYQIQTIVNSYEVTLTEVYLETSTGILGAKSKYSYGVYRTSASPSTNRHVFIANRENVPFNADAYWLYYRDDNANSTQEVQQITTTADVSGNKDGKYFLLYDTYKYNQYYVYYTVNGSGTDPMIAGYTGLNVNLAMNDSADLVASKTASVLNSLSRFTSTSLTNVITVSNDVLGYVPDIIDGQTPDNTGFTYAVTQQGGSAIIYARFLGGSELEQGERRNISDNDSNLIYDFVGSEGEFDGTPGYNYLAVGAKTNTTNYNSNEENLTKRVSKLTSMMADKAQDKTIQFAAQYEVLWNTTNGINQDITFLGPVAPTMSIYMPSSKNNGTLGLGGTLSLPVNSIAYLEVDRNNVFTMTDLSDLTVALIKDVPLTENIFVFATRGSDTSIYLWNGTEQLLGKNLTNGAISNILNANCYQEVVTIVSTIPVDGYEVQGPVVFDTVINLPLDSRDGGNAQGYVVGQGVLQLYLNGQALIHGSQWVETGVNGSASTTIQIKDQLEVDDLLEFRINTAGGYFGVGGGGGGGGGAGEANTASNVGSGAGVFKQKVGVDLQYKSLNAGVNTEISFNSNNIIIKSHSNVVLKTASSTILSTEHVVLVDATSGISTQTLPLASTVPGMRVDFKKLDNVNNVVIDTTGIDTIDGNASLAMTIQYQSFTLISSGSNWWIL